MNSLAAANSDRLIVRNINRESAENAAIVAQYDIRTQPVYILLDTEGNIAEKWFGAVKQAVFQTAIDDVLARSD